MVKISILEKIKLLEATKKSIREAIIQKGGEVKEEEAFSSYAGKIKELQNGGNKPFVSKKNVSKGIYRRGYIGMKTIKYGSYYKGYVVEVKEET